MISTEGKRERGKEGERSAAQIYGQQNTIIHRVMTAIGIPYTVNRDYWSTLIEDICGRKAGLSAMTLSERRELIRHLAARAKGVRVHNPGVPQDMGGWKKGDDHRSFKMIETQDPQMRMAYGLLLELGQRPQAMGRIVRMRYGVDHERWLSDEQVHGLVNYLLWRVKQHKEQVSRKGAKAQRRP